MTNDCQHYIYSANYETLHKRISLTVTTCKYTVFSGVYNALSYTWNRLYKWGPSYLMKVQILFSKLCTFLSWALPLVFEGRTMMKPYNATVCMTFTWFLAHYKLSVGKLRSFVQTDSYYHLNNQLLSWVYKYIPCA